MAFNHAQRHSVVIESIWSLSCTMVGWLKCTLSLLLAPVGAAYNGTNNYLLVTVKAHAVTLTKEIHSCHKSCS